MSSFICDNEHDTFLNSATPLTAATCTLLYAKGPISSQNVIVLLIREGSGVVLHERSQHELRPGSVVIIRAHTLHEIRPIGRLRLSVLALDSWYVLDQVFWQHRSMLDSKFDARRLADQLFRPRLQVVDTAGKLTSKIHTYFDDLVIMSQHQVVPRRVV